METSKMLLQNLQNLHFTNWLCEVSLLTNWVSRNCPLAEVLLARESGKVSVFHKVSVSNFFYYLIGFIIVALD